MGLLYLLGLIYKKLAAMKKIMKPGRVVILLAGRRAGKKAVIVKQFEDGKKGRQFPHALVAGVERCPLKVHKGQSKKEVKSKVKKIFTDRYNNPDKANEKQPAVDFFF